MTRLKYYFHILIIFIFLVSCREGASVKIKDTTFESSSLVKKLDSQPINSDSLQSMKPEQFTPISYIKKVAINDNKYNPDNWISMDSGKFPSNWVKLSDIDTLITLIYSTRKFNCFVTSPSNALPRRGGAEIGGYAILFINSFRQNKSVDLGIYSCPQADKKSADDIREWWQTYKER
jgi:hypothetical protein